jgi:hypothetical protein
MEYGKLVRRDPRCSHRHPLFGSGDLAFATEVIKTQKEELEDNDAFFDWLIEDGDCPNSETALRNILNGDCIGEGAEAMYGYVLSISDSQSAATSLL